MKNKEFEEYFLKYKNLVMRIVMNRTGNYQAAQEICQQVFISFYKNMEKVSPELVKAWLIRCTQNAVVDYLRRESNKNEVDLEKILSEEGNVLVEESLEIYEKKCCDRELAGRILREVRAVNEQWFEVLVMYCIEGLSYAEAAKRLHIPEPVLRARMYRARMYVRQKFRDEYKD